MKKTIKKIFLGVGVMAMLFIFPAIGDTIQHNYKQQCGVYEVHDTYTTFIDPCGYLWDVFDTDYVKGEQVVIYFHDNFTDFDRTDDIIKKVKRVD